MFSNNSMGQSPSWEADSFSANQGCPTLHGTRWLIIVFTKSASCLCHKTSHFFNILLILSVHLLLGFQCGLLPSGFLTKPPYALVFSPIRATWPAHHISLVFITKSYFVNGTNLTHCTWRGWDPGPVRIFTENSPTKGRYSRAVNPIASSYTYWATAAAILKGTQFQIHS